MKNKDQEIQETIRDTIDTIRRDERVAAYFFNKVKNPKFFPELAKEGFFSPSTIKGPEKTDGGYTFSFWPQANYLESLSKQIHSKEISDTNFIDLFVRTLRLLGELHGNVYLGRVLFSCVMNLPVEHLNVQDIELIFSWVNPRRVDDTLIEGTVHEGFAALLANLGNDSHSREIFRAYLNGLFSIVDRDKEPDPHLAYFTNYGLKNFGAKYFLIRQITDQKPFILDIFLAEVTALLESLLANGDRDRSSEYWRPAIESHSQNEFHDSAASIMVGLLYEVAEALLSRGKVPDQVQQWGVSNLNTFNRLYIALGSVAPNLISPDDVGRRILGRGLESHSRHEIFHFLKNNFQRLSETVRNFFLEAIEKLEADYTDDKDEKVIFSAWMKARWLQSLKDVPDERIKKMRDDLVSIIGDKEVEHPDFSAYMSSGWVGPNSPWTLGDFSSAAASEILDMLKNFKDKDHFREPSVEGLSRTFEDFIVADPVKVAALVDGAADLGYVHISSLFGGYSKAWGGKKFVPVEKLLSLALKLSRDKLFCEDLGLNKLKSAWAVSSIARFIIACTASDDNAIPPDLNSIAHEVLLNLIEHTRPDSQYVGSSDAYTRAINEPRGKLLEALIVLTLRRARIAGKDTDEFAQSWMALAKVFEPVLRARDESEVSIFALMGTYYRQFLYLNEKWFFDNFDVIVPNPDQNPTLWRSFMEGFGYVTVFVQEMYSKLMERGYLLRFLRIPDSEGGAGNRFDRLQHRGIELAVISYLLGHENLEKGLLANLIADRRPDEWRHMISSSISIVSHEKKPEHLIKLKSLMRLLIDLRKGDRAHVSWASHFKTADRILELLDDPSDPIVPDLLDISAADNANSWGFDSEIEFFHKFRDSKPDVIATLFLRLVSAASSPPLWPDDKVREICESLIGSHKVIVGEICRKYIERGVLGEPIKSIAKKL